MQSPCWRSPLFRGNIKKLYADHIVINWSYFPRNMLFLFSSLLINFGRICQSLLPFNPELTDFSDLTLSDKLISNVCFFNASTYWKYLFVKQFRDKSLLKLFVYFGKSDLFIFIFFKEGIPGHSPGGCKNQKATWAVFPLRSYLESKKSSLNQ